MSLAIISPTPEARDPKLAEFILYLSQNAPVPPPGSGSINNKNIEATIEAVKSVVPLFLNKAAEAKTVPKAASALCSATFFTSRYRDLKYVSANRKFLFGLGYHNKMIDSTRTVFARQQIEENAK